MLQVYDVEDKKDAYNYSREKNPYYQGGEKYCDPKAVENVIDYIAKEAKTKGYYGGYLCSNDPNEAINDFWEVKEQYDECNGKKLRHLIVDFGKRVGRDEALDYARKLAETYMPEYQSFFGVHYEHQRTHLHFAVNTIGCTSGERLKCSKEIVNLINSQV